MSECGGGSEAVSSYIYDLQCINMLPHHHHPPPSPPPPPIPYTLHLHSQDQNDISPQFPETQYNATIPEDIPSGSIVTQVSPIDQSAFRMCAVKFI